MKRIILTFGLVFIGFALFGQSPRIRLNQITKDSLTGSVVLSGLDSNMVYSRDFFLNLTDSVLILFGDTLSTTATAFTGVATDLTLTGNGTVGNELKVDTSVIATIKAISDSLAALSFASLQDITDTLDLNTRDYITGLRLTDTLNTNSRGFLTQNQTITLTDDATGTGTTSISVSVVDDSHNHTISTLTGIQDSLNSKAALVHTHTISDVAFLQDSLDAKANDSDLNNYLLTANYIVDSTRINATGDTAYYYQNGVLIGTGAIAGGGGGGSGTVTDITAGTFLSGGTITTSGTIALDTASAGLKTYIGENIGTVDLASEVTGTLPVANGGTGATTFTSGAFLKGNGTSAVSGSSNLTETADTVFVAKYLNVDTATLYVDAINNRVGIGTTTPTEKLDVDGNLKGLSFISYADTTDYTGGAFQAMDFNLEPPQASTGNLLARFRVFTNFASSRALVSFQKFRGSLASPQGVLNNDVIGGIGFGPALTTGNAGTATALVEAYADADATSTEAAARLSFVTGSTAANRTERLTIKSDGKVGIGTTAPGSQLHTKSATSNDALLVEDDSGACEAQPTTTGLTWSCSSDQRLKTDIQIPAAVLNYVKNIPLKDYTVIKTAERVMGPIAQELLETYPELVSTGADGYYRVSSLGSWTLVKAIQEQQSIIESQKAEIEQLKTQYNDLLQRIINLENK